MALPRAGTATELYIIPTVLEPPKTVTSQGAPRVEDGLKVGMPVPLFRSSNAEAAVVGRLRAGSSAEATFVTTPIELVVTNIRAVLEAYYVLVGQTHRLRRRVRNVRLRVPLLSVVRGTTQYLVDTQFTPFDPAGGSSYSIPLPTDRILAHAHGSSAALVLDRDGVLWLGIGVTNAGGSIHDLYAYRWDPERDVTWTSVAKAENIKADLAADPGGTIFQYSLRFSVAAAEFRGQVYFAYLSLHDGVWLYQLSQDPGSTSDAPKLVRVSMPIEIQSAADVTKFVLDGGMALAANARHILLAVSATDAGPTGGPHERRIYVSTTTAPVAFSSEEGLINSVHKCNRGNCGALTEPFTLARSTEYGVPRITFDRAGGAHPAGRFGWAAGAGYRTTDGGRSWSRMRLPVGIEFISAIAIASRNDTGPVYTLFAVGPEGLIMKSEDSGETWRIVRFGGDRALTLAQEWVGGTVNASTDTGRDNFRAVVFTTASVGFVISGSRLLRTTDGGNTWFDLNKTILLSANKQLHVNRTEFRDLIVRSGVLYVCGRVTGSGSAWSPLQGVSHGILRVANATTTSNAADFHLEYPSNYALNRLVDSGTTVQAVGDAGAFLFRTSLATWAPRTVRAYRSYNFKGIQIIGIDPQTDTVIIAADGRDPGIIPAVMIGKKGGTPEIPEARDFRAYTIPRFFREGEKSGLLSSSELNDVQLGENNVALLGTIDGVVLFDWAAVQTRVYPSAVALGDGFLLACANTDTREFEIWSVRPGERAERIEAEGLEQFSETAIASWEPGNPPPTTVPYPTLVAEPVGGHQRLHLLVGKKAYVSDDEGKTWLSGTNSLLDLLTGDVNLSGTTVTENDLNRSRTGIVLPGGLFLSVARTASGTLVPFASRQWKVTGTVRQGMPIRPGISIRLGVDGLQAIFSGEPMIGDRWKVSAEYGFKRQNVAIESPSIYWQSPGTHETQDILFTWQVASGHNITAVALLGTNFAAARVGFSADGTNFTETYRLAATVDSGATFTQPKTNVARMSTKRWIPGQFRPGPRTYYFGVGTETPELSQLTKVAKILDNTEDELLLQLPPGGISPGAWVVYTDRMVGITGNVERFEPYFRLRILGLNPTFEGKRRLGTVVIGTYTPFSNPSFAPGYTVPGTTTVKQRDRFSRGWRWRVEQPIAAYRGPSGVSNVEQLGRAVQRWQLDYEAIERADRDQLLALLQPNLGQAFAVVFDAPTLQPTVIDRTANLELELVRLEQHPEVENAIADRWNVPIELVEVI